MKPLKLKEILSILYKGLYITNACLFVIQAGETAKFYCYGDNIEWSRVMGAFELCISKLQGHLNSY